MKLASCPVHGRQYLVNAGAPVFARCLVQGCSTSVVERCQSCRGEGSIVVSERYGMKTVPTAKPCERCEGRGWHSRGKALGSPYPVS